MPTRERKIRAAVKAVLKDIDEDDRGIPLSSLVNAVVRGSGMRMRKGGLTLYDEVKDVIRGMSDPIISPYVSRKLTTSQLDAIMRRYTRQSPVSRMVASVTKRRRA